MDILEIRFDKELKKQVNNKLEYIDSVISDELADIYPMLINLNIPEKEFNKIIDKLNNVKKYIQAERIKK